MRHPWWRAELGIRQRERTLCPDTLIEAATGQGVQALGDLGGAASDPQDGN